MLAILLPLFAFFSVVHSQHDVGIARDEVVYMDHGARYATWWTDLVTGDASLSDASITKTWGGKESTANNREHPPLVKTLMGLSDKLLHDKLGIVDETTAFRVPTAAFFALLVYLVFAFTRRTWGLPQAVVAGLLTLLMPRAFFHAQLACFDAPIACMWFATLYAYDRAIETERRRWIWGAGVVFGLALATKHNALLLPAAIGLHALWTAWRGAVHDDGGWPAAMQRRWRQTVAWLGPRGPRRWILIGGAVVQLPISALALGFYLLLGRTRALLVASLGVVGPLTLYAVWPWLWHAPIERVADWLGFHLSHVHYNFEYLGQNYNAPPFPWHVALITTLLTVPVVTLVGSAIGAAVLLVRARRGGAGGGRAPGVLLLLSMALSMGPFLLGSTPIFGAEKHWQPAMASLAIAAGVGVVWAALSLAGALAPTARAARRQRVIELGALAVVGVAVVGAAAVETFRAQPYALSHYNALAGGAPGGADLGMNRQFWGYAARGVLPYLAANAPTAKGQTAPVYTHDARPAWGYYKRGAQAGVRVPGSMPDAGMEDAGVAKSAWAFVVHERHFLRHDIMIWDEYGTVAPTFVLRTGGVPIVSVYRRPARTGE